MIRKAYSGARVACAVQPAQKRRREDITRASRIDLTHHDASERFSRSANSVEVSAICPPRHGDKRDLSRPISDKRIGLL